MSFTNILAPNDEDLMIAEFCVFRASSSIFDSLSSILFVDAIGHMIEKNNIKEIEKNENKNIHWDYVVGQYIFNTLINSIQNDFYNYLCLFIPTHFL